MLFQFSLDALNQETALPQIQSLQSKLGTSLENEFRDLKTSLQEDEGQEERWLSVFQIRDVKNNGADVMLSWKLLEPQLLEVRVTTYQAVADKVRIVVVVVLA
ncbi:MAG: hypothetical protein MK135_13250 [Polyangiaceae bacterium]|nr:hypothetical protein [Polyangiaceae bacterium]